MFWLYYKTSTVFFLYHASVVHLRRLTVDRNTSNHYLLVFNKTMRGDVICKGGEAMNRRDIIKSTFADSRRFGRRFRGGRKIKKFVEESKLIPVAFMVMPRCVYSTIQFIFFSLRLISFCEIIYPSKFVSHCIVYVFHVSE